MWNYTTQCSLFFAHFYCTSKNVRSRQMSSFHPHRRQLPQIFNKENDNQIQGIYKPSPYYQWPTRGHLENISSRVTVSLYFDFGRKFENKVDFFSEKCHQELLFQTKDYFVMILIERYRCFLWQLTLERRLEVKRLTETTILLIINPLLVF